MLLSEAWEKYRADKRIEGFSQLTLDTYQYQLNMLKRFLGDRQIASITTEELKSYLVKKGSHLKPSSLGHRVRFIRSLFRWAHEEGYIFKNPAAKLKEPKIGKRVPKFLNKREIEYLREACDTILEKTLFEFIFSTGCRVGEVMNLNREDINFYESSVVVKGKGDKEREVYFSMRCAIWLERYLESRQDDERSLFVTERKPIRRRSTDSIRYVIKRIAKKSKLNKSIYPHQLRHSYATHLINNGAPIEVIQSLLGHEKSETTRIYAELSGKIRRDLYDKYFE